MGNKTDLKKLHIDTQVLYNRNCLKKMSKANSTKWENHSLKNISCKHFT